MALPRVSRARMRVIRNIMRKKKARLEHGVFAAEGLKLTKDLIRKGGAVCEVLLSESFVQSGHARAFLEDVPEGHSYVVTDKDFKSLSSLQSSQGVLALFALPEARRSLDEFPEGSLVVLLENVQDPGNAGAVIRTAAAFSLSGVLLMGDDTSDVFNPKVVRASAGSVLDVPIISLLTTDTTKIRKAGFSIWAARADQHHAQSIENLERTGSSLVIAFGNEGAGLSKGLLREAERFFTVPTSNRVESLNVAVAAAISMFHLTRGR